MALVTSGSGFSNYQNQSQTATPGAGATPLGVGSVGFPTSYTPWPGLTETDLRQQLPLGTGEVPIAPDSGNMNPNVEFGTSTPQLTAGGTTTIQQEYQNLLQQYVSDPNYMPQFQDQLILGGFLNPTSHGSLGYTPGTMMPGDATWMAYKDLLLESSALGVPWQQLLQKNIQNGVGETKFNLSKTYDRLTIPTPDDARAYLTSEMESMLGRRPTNSEISAFAGQLQQAAQVNPTHVTDVYDVSAFLNSSRSLAPVGSFSYGISGLPHTETTSGGINPEAEAQSFVYQHAGKELGQVNADQIYNLFTEMIGSGGGSNGG